jgi:hypothetical protein
VQIVDLDRLFQSPQKDTRIIGGMEVNNPCQKHAQELSKLLEKKVPFYRARNMHVTQILGKAIVESRINSEFHSESISDSPGVKSGVTKIVKLIKQKTQ